MTQNSSNFTTSDSKVIDFVRFPLAIFVVIHHSFGETIQYQYNTILDLTYFDAIRCALSHVLVHVDNPAFFFISGYLFFIGGGITLETYWNKIRKRIKTLLIPYLSWNILTLIVGAIIHYAGHREVMDYLSLNANLHIFWDAIKTNVINSGPLHLCYEAFTPINGPLWFIRDLMVASLLSPLVYFVIKYTKGYIILFFTLVFCANLCYPILGIGTGSIYFFSLGASFSILGLSFTSILNKVKTVLIPLTIIIAIPTIFYDGMNTEWGFYIYPIFVTCSTLTFFLLASKLAISATLTEKSIAMKKHVFFIYGSHVGLYIVPVVSMAFAKLCTTGSHFVSTISYFATIILVSIICIVLSIFLSKVTPNFYNVITGNRK